MSAFKTEFGPAPFTFSVAPAESDRRNKISMPLTSEKLGTVLLEDLARSAGPRGLEVVATFEMSEVSCELTYSGELEIEAEPVDLPAYLQINDEGHIDVLTHSGHFGKKS